MIKCGSGGRHRAALFRCAVVELAEFRDDAVRSERRKQVKLGLARALGPMVGEVDDLALARPLDGGVRLVDKALQPLGEPVIAARLPHLAVHTLLDHGPMAVVGDNETVQVEIEAVLHGGAVDLGDEPAGGGERRSVEAHLISDRDQLVRGLAREPAAPAADVNPELALQRREPALERSNDAGRDAGRVPVHAHDGPERLEPERVSQAAQQLVAPVVMDDGLADDRAEPGHAIGQPARHVPAMERQIGGSSSSRHR